MADITLAGEELTFDLEKLTITEYRELAASSMFDSKNDDLLARAIDKPIEWVHGLSQPAYVKLLKAFFKKAANPLSDPN